VTEIPAGSGLSFEVQVQNQGQSNEQDVPVSVTIEGGDEPIELEGSLDTLASGDTGMVSVPLKTTPTTGEKASGDRRGRADRRRGDDWQQHRRVRAAVRRAVSARSAPLGDLGWAG
jgi:hypothetical protein